MGCKGLIEQILRKSFKFRVYIDILNTVSEVKQNVIARNESTTANTHQWLQD